MKYKKYIPLLVVIFSLFLANKSEAALLEFTNINEGQNFIAGKSYVIKWKINSDKFKKVTLQRGSGYHLMDTEKEEFMWNIPLDHGGKNYLVLVSDFYAVENGAQTFERVESNKFNIIWDAQINITKPQTNDKFTTDKQIPLDFNFTSILDYDYKYTGLKFQLYNEGVLYKDRVLCSTTNKITSNIEKNNSFLCSLNDEIPTYDKYQIKIYSVGTGLEKMSPYFSIKNINPDKELSTREIINVKPLIYDVIAREEESSAEGFISLDLRWKSNFNFFLEDDEKVNYAIYYGTSSDLLDKKTWVYPSTAAEISHDSYMVNLLKNTDYYYKIEAKYRDVTYETEIKKIKSYGDPIIEILYPNGGEKLEIGKTYEIKWKQQNAQMVNISVLDLASVGEEIVKNLTMDIGSDIGVYRWVVPENYKNKNGQYKIYISSGSSGASSRDKSDNGFTFSWQDKDDSIDSLLDLKSKFVLPSKDNYLKIGNTYKINWESNSNKGKQFFVNLWLDMGQSNEDGYNVILPITPFQYNSKYFNSVQSANKGYYEWKIPSDIDMSDVDFNQNVAYVSNIFLNMSDYETIINRYVIYPTATDTGSTLIIPTPAKMEPKKYRIFGILYNDRGSNLMNSEGGNSKVSQTKYGPLDAVRFFSDYFYISQDAEKLNNNTDKLNIIQNKENNINSKKIIIKNNKLKGKIILKVEDNGKAYYVNPKDSTMHFLGRPDDAFGVMRAQGVGITNINLEKIAIGSGEKFDIKKVDNNFAKQQTGKIFLQIEKNGEAWYINPSDNKRYFLGRPTDAFNVMKKLGLGISNNDFDGMSK